MSVAMQLNGRRYGHIRVEGILGQGAMGHVYEGFDETLARRVALKVLQPESRLDGEARTRLIREARALSQLDHPNVCRIYDFIEGGDADVLVLELIDGRTLEQALQDGLSLTEKLRIARDVAAGLVAAHRAGILHRDLKPENVMLTSSGQVKVLDFGLARWIEQKAKTGRARAPSGPHIVRPHAVPADADRTAVRAFALPDVRVPGSATEFGLTVGTPLFMSPEQARGETLTTASDVYSFALLLQAMFTGREPYPENLDAHDVMAHAARGGSLPVSGVRRDIAALIRALKAFAPSDRPTAADALRRIEHIIGAPKRILRDVVAVIVVVVMLLGAWKYTVDLRRAEAEARKQRSQADALIGFMLGDLRKKLEPVGKLDILDGVGTRALEYLSSLDTKSMTPQEIGRQAQALYQLADVRITNGNLAGAIEVSNKALALAEIAANRDRLDPELALGLGTAHFWVGEAHRRAGDLGDALTHMREYARITEELAKRYPHIDEYQTERIDGHSNIGTILEAQGDLAGALEEYRLTLGIRQARLAAVPSDKRRRADEAGSLNKVGFALERLGRLAEARDYYERERAILEPLAAEDAKNMVIAERLATSYGYGAGILELLGDDAGALRRRDEALALTRRLAAHDPANARWRRSLAIALLRHASLLRRRGTMAEALSELRESEALLRQLVAKDPARSDTRNDLARVDVGYSVLFLAQHDAAAARDKAAEAVSLLSRISGDRARLSLAAAQIALGDAEAASGDRRAAATSWQAASVNSMPSDGSAPEPRQIASLATALLRLGRTNDTLPLIAHLHEIGYREADLEQLLRR
jgi:eukaryotic-like serine/threonine-protein kinase